MKLWLVLGCLAAIASGEPDVRQASWGMSRAQVMAAEAGRPSEVRDDRLRYDTVKVGGLEASLWYFFQDGKLVRARYVFTAEHADPGDYIADFQKVHPLLGAHYGEPAVDRAMWGEEPRYQTESKRYLDSDRATPAEIFASDKNIGLEVAEGRLTLYTQWRGLRSKIVHILSGHDLQITHQIEFSPHD